MYKLKNRTHEGQWHLWDKCMCHLWEKWHLFFEQNPTCQALLSLKGKANDEEWHTLNT